MNNIRGGRVTCYMDDIQLLRSFGEGDTDQAMNWSKKGTKSALTLEFSCDRASILSSRIRAFKTLCAASASRVEPGN